MYIRVKKVKKKSGKVYEYGHLVLSKWRKRAKIRGGSRNPVQKYKKFIGRVYRYEPSYFCELEDFLGGDFEKFVERAKISEIYKKLIEYELISCGFKKHHDVFREGDVFVDLYKLMVYNSKGDVIIKTKERGGYLCNLNLEELFKFEYLRGRSDGMELLKRIKMNGIKIEGDKFFILANKLLKEGMKFEK